MKVLMITNMYPSNKYPTYGIFVKNFKEILDEIGIEVESVVLTKNNNKFIKLFKYFNYYFKIIFKILFAKYDLVYVHYISNNSVPLLICKKIKKYKLWINVHGTDIIPQNHKQEIWQKYVRNILPKADKIIVPSNYFKSVLNVKFNIDEEVIDIIPSGGVSEKVFYQYEKADVIKKKKEYGILAQEKVIGYVGRIDSQKGWNVFLESVNFLNQSGYLKDKKVIVVGSGNEINEFNKLRDKLNLREIIIHIPLVQQKILVDIFNIFDVLCFPSYQESLGLVPLEAMACGIPVIASDIEVVKEYIYNNINGFTFKCGDYLQLSEKIKCFFKMSNHDIDSLKVEAMKISSRYKKSVVSENIRKMFSKEILQQKIKTLEGER